MKIFKQAQEIKKLKRANKDLHHKIILQETENEKWSNMAKKTEQDIVKIKNATRKIESERDELKALVKSQIKSELLMTSLKIVFEMLQPKKKIPDQFYLYQLQAQQQALQGQLSGLGSSYSSSVWGNSPYKILG